MRCSSKGQNTGLRMRPACLSELGPVDSLLKMAVAPNGKHMHGKFKSSWSTLFKALGELTTYLQALLPPMAGKDPKRDRKGQAWTLIPKP